MWFCANAADNNTSVCSSSPTNTLNNSSSGGNLQTVLVASPGALFNVTIKADPSQPYVKFGPGAGITCKQRSGSGKTGTSNGITLTLSGLDWTGGGLPFYNFWFTRCSFDAGVTYAEFYAEFD